MDMPLFWVVILILVGNAATLVRRLWLRISHGVTDTFPRLELFFDALTVISGTYVLALLVDLTLSGRIPRWGVLDYVFVGAIALNVVLTATCSVIAGRSSRPGK
jgi:hypothetical protein